MGCLPILGIVFLVIVVALVRGVLNTLWNVAYGFYLTVKESILKPFQPTPLESEIEDLNYYTETQLKDKLYDKNDGEYTSFKEIKNKG